MKQQDDSRLDKILAAYAISVDAGEDSVGKMVRLARIRAVQLGRTVEEKGFFATILCVFGIRHPDRAVWSAVAGLSIALMMGVSLGATDIIPELDEHAFTVDFDTVMGSGAVAVGNEAAL